MDEGPNTYAKMKSLCKCIGKDLQFDYEQFSSANLNKLKNLAFEKVPAKVTRTDPFIQFLKYIYHEICYVFKSKTYVEKCLTVCKCIGLIKIML